MLNNNIRREELLMHDSIEIHIRPYIEVETLQLYILKAERSQHIPVAYLYIGRHPHPWNLMEIS